MTYEQFCNLGDNDRLMCQYGYPQFVLSDEELYMRKVNAYERCKAADDKAIKLNREFKGRGI